MKPHPMMTHSMKIGAALSALALLLSPALCAADPATPADVTTDQGATPESKDKEKGTLLHPKVEKPIADTYEPLGSTSYDRAQDLNKPVDESIELKRQAKENKRAKEAGKAGNEPGQTTPAPMTSEEQRALESKIQDGTTPAAQQPAAPKIESDEGALRIQDPQ